MDVFLSTVEQTLKAHAKIREAYSNYLSSVFKKENYSPNEINILIFLHNNPAMNTSKDITLTLGVSKGLISRSVDSLVTKGLLDKKIDKYDRRNYRLFLNSKTKPLIEKMETSKRNFSNILTNSIEAKDLAIYQNVLQQINTNMQKLIEGVKENENQR